MHHIYKRTRRRRKEGKGKEKGRARTTAEPMVVHLAGVALDGEVLGGALEQAEGLGRDHDVGGVGAAGPFLAVGAVAEGRGGGFARELVLDGRAHAGAFGHGGRSFGEKEKETEKEKEKEREKDGEMERCFVGTGEVDLGRGRGRLFERGDDGLFGERDEGRGYESLSRVSQKQ